MSKKAEASFGRFLRVSLVCIVPALFNAAPAAAGAQLTSYVDRSLTCTGSGATATCFCEFEDLTNMPAGKWLVVRNVSFGGTLPPGTIVSVPYAEYRDNDLAGAFVRNYLTHAREVFVSNTKHFITLSEDVQILLTSAPFRLGFEYTGTKPANTIDCSFSGERRDGLAIP